ncbi:MAG TPA: HIT domain-containing protein, partial [Geobacterales bacterium]|nr:HIT domain-containing protein [Geobacterales bacterium]
TGELADLDDKELLELMQLVRRCTFVLKKAMGPQGFNVGINMGQAGGAGIAEHLHIHVVPRWSGDANFMSVLADARVIPEGLDSTYERLFPLFHYSDHDREKSAP